MAVAFVQAQSNNTGTASANATVTLPAAPTSGNLLVCQIALAGNSAPTLPTGWTQLASGAAAGGSSRSYRMFFKIAGAGESATQTFTTSSALWEIHLAEYSGIDTTTPFTTGQAINTQPAATTAYATNALTVAAGTSVLLVGMPTAIATGATRSGTAWSNPVIGGQAATFRTNNNLNNTQTTGYGATIDLVVASAAASYTASATSPVSAAGAFGFAAFNAAASTGPALSGTAALTGSGTLTPSGTVVERGTLAGSGALGVGAKPALPGTVTLAAAGTLTSGVVAPAASTLVDDFTTQDTSKWTGWSTNVAVASGQLQITPATWYPTLYAAGRYSLVGSSFLVEAPQVLNVGLGSTASYMQLVLDANNSLQIGGNTATIRFESQAGNVWTGSDITYDPVAHRWWLISESGGTITWSSSPDGLTWTVQRTLAAPFDVSNLQPTFGSGFWDAETAPGVTVFDNVNAAPSTPAASTLTDDFATQDTSKWTGWGTGVLIDAGRLRVDTTAAYSGAASVNKYDLRGSTLTVEIVQLPNLGSGTTSAYLSAFNANNSVDIFWEGGVIGARYQIGGTPNVVTTTYNATAHRIWRIRESGGTLYWEASSTGATWSNIRSPVPTPLNLGSLTVQLLSGYYGTEATPGSAIFDNVNATYAGPPPAPRTFYIDPAGSDSNDGLSAGTPWATVAKVTNTVLYPGDQVLFERGGTWTGLLTITGGGSSASPVTIGAYGTGAQPIISGGGSSGVAGTTNACEVYASWVVVDGIEFRGASDTDVYFNAADCTIQNCTVRWGSYGIHQGTQAARLKILSNTVVDVNVGIIGPGTNDDSGASGVLLEGDAAEVAHNTISGCFYTSPDYGVDGSAVEVWGATNAVVHHNSASECVAFGELGNTATDSVTYHDNVFTSTISISNGFVIHGDLYADGSDDPFGPVTGTKIHQNTVVLTSGNAASIGVWMSPNGELDLRNNIIVVAGSSVMVQIYATNRVFTEAGNVFWNTAGNTSNIALPAGVNASSTVADPLFVSSTDYRLRSGSPALDRGTDLGYTTDYAGNPRVIGAAPDSGAYEGVAVTAASGTATLSGTGSLAAAAVPSVTAARALTATGVLTTVAVPRVVAAPALAGSGTLTATAVPAVAGAVALAGAGALAAVAVPAVARPVALAGSGSLSSAAVVAVARPVTLTGSGTLGAAAVPAAAGAAGLGSVGTLAVAAASAGAGPVTLTGAGTLTPAGVPRAAGAAGLSGTGVLAFAAPAVAVAAPVALLASGTLQVAAVPAATGAAALAGSGSLTGSALPAAVYDSTVYDGSTYSPEGALAFTGSGALGVTAAGTRTGVIALAGSGALGAVAVPAPTGVAALTAAASLTATTAAVTAAGTVALAAAAALTVPAVAPAAAGAAAFAGTGALSVSTAPSPAASVALSASGSLSVPARVPSVAAAVALSATGGLAAAAAPAFPPRPAALAASGTLTVAAAGSGAGQVVLTAAAALTLSALPAAQGVAGLTTQGALTISPVGLTAAGAVTLTAAGVLTVPVRVPAPAAGVALAATGVLTSAATAAAGGVATLTGVGSLAVLGAGGAGLVPLTATGTLSAGAAAFTVSAAVALTGVGALGVSVSVVAAAGSAVLAATGALGLAAAPAPVAAAAFTATGSLTVPAVVAAAAAAGLSSSGLLVVATGAGGGGLVALSAAATLTTVVVPRPTGAAALAASGVLALAAVPAAKGAPALTGLGVLTAAGAVTAAVPLTGAGALAVAVVPRPAGAGDLTASGALLVAAVVAARGAVTLTGAAVLGMAAAAVTVTVAAALSGEGQLTVAGVGLGAVVHRPNLGRTPRGAAGVTRRPDLGRTNHS